MSVGRSVLLVVLVASAMSNLDQSIVAVALPTLQRDFGAEIGLIKWVVIAYQLGIVGTLLIAGWLADRVGARRIFLAGLACFTLASGFCGLSLTAWQLIGARGLQGIGTAMLLASGQALLTDAYPSERRGSAMGFMHMAVAAGLTAGPALGGLLISLVSWRAIFLVNLPLGLITWWLAWRQLPALAGPPAPSLSWNGSWLRSWPLLAGLLAAFLAFVALASNMFLIPFALQSVMGLPPADAGLVMIAVPLTILVVAPLSGRLTDRIGPRWPATFGIGVVAGAILLMAQLQPVSTIAFAVLTLVVYGIGAGLFQAPNNAAVMTAAPTGARGTISGVLALARSLGQIAGVALVGTIWSWRLEIYLKNEGMEDALTSALRDAFLVLALFAVAAAMVSLLRGGPALREREGAYS